MTATPGATLSQVENAVSILRTRVVSDAEGDALTLLADLARRAVAPSSPSPIRANTTPMPGVDGVEIVYSDDGAPLEVVINEKVTGVLVTVRALLEVRGFTIEQRWRWESGSFVRLGVRRLTQDEYLGKMDKNAAK